MENIMAKINLSQKADVYQLITNRLIEIMDKGIIPWRQPWNHGYGSPRNLVSKRHYQGINVFILACYGSNYGSPYWLTFKQAQDLGGSVRRGQRGTPVVFWKLYDKDDPESDTGISTIPVLRYYTVFNTEQCEGIPVPPPEGFAWANHNPIEAAEAVIRDMPNRPAIEIGGNRACYSPSRDLVKVPDLFRYEHAEEYYSVLYHELGHSTGHKSRLNRDGITENHFFGSPDYSREELIAEMTSAFLCGHTGIENATLQNSAAYIQNWIRTLKGDKRLAINAGSFAQKACNYILGHHVSQDCE